MKTKYTSEMLSYLYNNAASKEKNSKAINSSENLRVKN